MGDSDSFHFSDGEEVQELIPQHQMTRTPFQTAKQLATTTAGVVVGVIGLNFGLNIVKKAAAKVQPAPVVSPAKRVASPVPAWAPLATKYFCAAMDQGMSPEEAGEDTGLEMVANHEEATAEMLEVYENQRKEYLKTLISSIKTQCPEHLG